MDTQRDGGVVEDLVGRRRGGRVDLSLFLLLSVLLLLDSCFFWVWTGLCMRAGAEGIQSILMRRGTRRLGAGADDDTVRLLRGILQVREMVCLLTSGRDEGDELLTGGDEATTTSELHRLLNVDSSSSCSSLKGREDRTRRGCCWEGLSTAVMLIILLRLVVYEELGSLL
jgi:hypothetical protein